jgi:hypothetical protein
MPSLRRDPVPIGSKRRRARRIGLVLWLPRRRIGSAADLRFHPLASTWLPRRDTYARVPFGSGPLPRAIAAISVPDVREGLRPAIIADAARAVQAQCSHGWQLHPCPQLVS